LVLIAAAGFTLSLVHMDGRFWGGTWFKKVFLSGDRAAITDDAFHTGLYVSNAFFIVMWIFTGMSINPYMVPEPQESSNRAVIDDVTNFKEFILLLVELLIDLSAFVANNIFELAVSLLWLFMFAYAGAALSTVLNVLVSIGLRVSVAPRPSEQPQPPPEPTEP